MVISSENCCTLTPDQQKIRRSRVRATIIPLVHKVIRADGELQLLFINSAESRDLLEKFIAFEQECCSFLSFLLSEDGDDLTVLVQGPADAAHVLDMYHQTIMEDER